jgi:hypothetical protein
MKPCLGTWSDGEGPSGRVTIATPKLENETIQETCKIAVLDDGLTPNFFMIDGAYAELNAIGNVSPYTAVRMCQFHLMQAWELPEEAMVYTRDITRSVTELELDEDTRPCKYQLMLEHRDDSSYDAFRPNQVVDPRYFRYYPRVKGPKRKNSLSLDKEAAPKKSRKLYPP